MEDTESVTARVRAALGRLGVDLHRHPVGLEYADGVLTMEGALPDIATKKRALERGAALPEVRWVAARLRVEPATTMGDGEIRDHVRDALLAEPTFEECAFRVHRGGAIDAEREPPVSRGVLDVAIDDGVVRLEGAVPSLSHKRLAGVLCWWVPGTRVLTPGWMPRSRGASGIKRPSGPRPSWPRPAPRPSCRPGPGSSSAATPSSWAR